MQALEQIGLKARVSELDVSDPTQYAAYGDILSACVGQANCTGVTTWGISDAYSSGGGIADNGSYETGPVSYTHLKRTTLQHTLIA